MLKKMIKIAAGILLSLLAVLLIYVALEAILSRIEASRKDSGLVKDIRVFVLSNGVHTDIVLPVKSDLIDWFTVFPYANNLNQTDSNYSYVWAI